MNEFKRLEDIERLIVKIATKKEISRYEQQLLKNLHEERDQILDTIRLIYCGGSNE